MRSLPPLTLLLLTVPAAAHEREFTRSRDWHLPYEGEHEFELRSFIDTTHGDWRAQVEYEYGVTRHFAIEPGLEVKENEEGETEIEAAELELRFNFLEYERFRWLPAFNLEYEHPFEDEEASAVELKSVLSRYGRRDDLTINLDFGKELEGEHESESELTAGWSHALDLGQTSDGGQRWRFGLEALEDFESDHLRAGPLVSFRTGPHFHVLGSYLMAVDERGEGNIDELTLILEFEL